LNLGKVSDHRSARQGGYEAIADQCHGPHTDLSGRTWVTVRVVKSDN
jgi:hypothetical protein